MKNAYDVVIVGAGPGGAMAAKVAGENGLKACLIERKTEISKIRRICTMIININEENFGEYITYRNKRFIFPHNGFTINYDGPMRNIYGFHIVTPDGTRFRLGDVPERDKDKAKVVGLMIDKGRLVQTMVDEAVANGVELFPNTNINNARKEADCVVVTDNRGNEYRGTFVIAAKPTYELLAKNVIEGDDSQVNASPAVDGGKLYLRSDKALYCIGE